MCETPVFHWSSSIAKGPAKQDCLTAVVNEVSEGTAPAGAVALLSGFINVPEKERNKLNYEVVQIALNRNTSYANIFHHRGVTYCYKRYASLFFLIGISEDENEMIALMFLHRIVEAMDKYFGNVCELDVIFNFERVHALVDELLMAGQIQETSLKEVNKAVCNADSIQEEELNSDVEAVINLQQWGRQVRRV